MTKRTLFQRPRRVHRLLRHHLNARDCHCDIMFLSATTTTLIVSKVNYCCWMHVTVHYLPGCTRHSTSYLSDLPTTSQLWSSRFTPVTTSHCRWSLIFCCWTTALWQRAWRCPVCFNTDNFLVDNLNWFSQQRILNTPLHSLWSLLVVSPTTVSWLPPVIPHGLCKVTI